MPTKPQLRLALSLLSLFLSACAVTLLPPAPNRARQRLVHYKELRVAVLDFTPWYGEKGDHSKTIPAILLSELETGGRFSSHESAGFQGKIDGSGDKYIDMYVSGTVVSMTSNQICVEVRMSNSVSHEILYSKLHCIANQEPGRRKNIKVIANEIAKSVDKDNISLGTVLGVDGKMVILDRGTKVGVKPGMIADLMAASERLDTARHPVLYNRILDYTKLLAEEGLIRKQPLSEVPIIVGSVFIVSVAEGYSMGVLFRGDYASPDDKARFR